MQWMMDSQVVLMQITLTNHVDIKADNRTLHKTIRDLKTSVTVGSASDDLGGIQEITSTYNLQLPLHSWDDFDSFETKMGKDTKFSAEVVCSIGF